MYAKPSPFSSQTDVDFIALDEVAPVRHTETDKVSGSLLRNIHPVCSM